MPLPEIQAEIELIEAEARRMAPSEAEFRRRFPTMAGRLQTLLEQRDRLTRGGARAEAHVDDSAQAPRTGPIERPPAAAPRPAPARKAVTPPAFLDLREQLLEGDDAARSGAAKSARAVPPPGAPAAKDLAARDAEIQRLREERDDWKAKAEGIEGRLAKAVEIARKLEIANTELDELRDRVASLEAEVDPGIDSSAESGSAEHLAEIDHLRDERDAMQIAHHQELDRLRERHREELETFQRLDDERSSLETRLHEIETQSAEIAARHEAELRALTEERDSLRQRLDAAGAEGRKAIDELHADLESTRERAAVLEGGRQELLGQLERATLDRSVVSLGILQSIQSLPGRVQADPRYTAIPESEPILGDVRRTLFRELEQFGEQARTVGTDMGAESFLHAVAARLDTIPEWIGRLLEALAQVTRTERDVLADREADARAAREALATAESRVTELMDEASALHATLDAARREAIEHAAQAQSEIAGLRAELDTERGRLGTLERELVESQQERDQLEARSKRDTAELSRLEEALESSELRMTNLESELAAARRESDQLTSSLADERARSADAERRGQELDTALAEARARLDVLRTAIEQSAGALSKALGS